MRKRNLAVLLAVALMAGGGLASSAQADHWRTDLNLRGVIYHIHHDRDAAGRWTPGDRIDLDFDLRDQRRGGRAGDGDGRCVVTRTRFGDVETARCNVQFDLWDGRLFMQGEVSRRAFEGRQSFALRVVDGTRHYAGSQGRAQFFTDRDARVHDGRDRGRRHGRAVGFTSFVHFDRDFDGRDDRRGHDHGSDRHRSYR